jgi:ASC-1-like (ASCH) protein
MNHEMRLDPVLFEEVSSGLKLVESRLNDEKRQKLRVGDIIKFYKQPDGLKEVDVKVLELHQYRSIKELVDATPLEYFGPRFKDKLELLNASWPYNSDKIEKYGLLNIYIQRI